MADYHAVLKRTLSNFGEPSQSLRTKIYEKARATISRQLDATQPPLSDETKAAQLAQLDEAIARMEAEYAGPDAEFAGDPPPLPLGTPSAAAPPEREPEPEPELAVTPEAEAMPEPMPAPEPVSEPEPVIGSEPAETPAPAAAPPGDKLAEAFAALEAARAGVEEDPREPNAVGEPTASSDPEPETPSADETRNTVSFDDDAFSAAAASAAAPAGNAEPADASVADGARDLHDPPAEPPPDAGPRPEYGSLDTIDVFDDPKVAEREAAALAGPPVAVPPARRRSGAGVVVFLLLIAVIGLLFVFRQPLLGAVGMSSVGIDRFVAGLPVVGPYLVGEVDDPNDPTRPTPVPTIRITPEPEADTPQPEVEQGKREQRMGPDGQEVDPAAGREDVGTLPPPILPAPTVPGDDAATEQSEVPITPAEPRTNASADEPATAKGTEQAAGGTEAAPAETPAEPRTVAVAQSAILYEEGGGARETRSDRGNVVWSVVQESPGNDEPAEPAIRAVLDVPERELKATITIRRNRDKALAASHLMEVNFEPAAGFSGQNVDEILAVRMKPDERSQGTPLSVVPAKIAPGYFYVALDNLPSARDRNVSLLRTAKWIDVPVEYVTGRRALLSLEKGVVGERVFSQALAAWDAASQ